MSTKVILADDHSIVIDGMKVVIERTAEDVTVVGTASNGKEVLKMAKDNPADIYILDISMPVLNGIDTTARIVKQCPKASVIILSMHDDRTFVEKALRNGAKGYVLKENATEEIIEAIKTVSNGGTYLSPKIAKFVQHDFHGKRSQYSKFDRVVELTRKEREVLQLIAEGYSNREVAESMNLSANTIHVHRNNIMRKLDIHRQADLIRYAIKEGITSL